MKRALFALGQIVATPGAIELMKMSNIDGLALLQRHVTATGETLTTQISRKTSCLYRKDFGFCRLTARAIVSCG
jgi:hypothetical protein